MNRAEKIIDEMIKNNWIDRLTRTAIVEFTLYNANVNLLAYVICMAEFPETGGAFTWFDVQSFRPSMLVDANGVTTIICLSIFTFIIVIMVICLVQKIKKNKCKAVKNFWTCIDLIICCFGCAAIIVWACKFTVTRKVLKSYYNDKSKFVNFQHIVVWEYMYNCLLGILCFFSVIRLLKALGYNKRLTQIATVLKVGGEEMIQFFVVFFFAFSGFVILGYLLFGSSVYEWRNLFVSFGSLTNTLIGRNSLDKLVQASPNFAEVYFFLYVFFIIFTLMTVFIAILNQAIEDVRGSPDSKEDTIGVTDILRGSIQDFLQMFGLFIGRKTTRNNPSKRLN